MEFDIDDLKDMDELPVNMSGYYPFGYGYSGGEATEIPHDVNLERVNTEFHARLQSMRLIFTKDGKIDIEEENEYNEYLDGLCDKK